MVHRAAAATCLSLLLATTGCSRGCKNDHPYVPYAVDDAPPGAGGADAEVTSEQASDDAGEPPSSAEPALLAPAGATRWSVEGLELVAPPEREIVSAIVRDVDGDGRKDALALVRPAPARGKAAEAGGGEIVFFAGASSPPAASVIATAPPARGDAACTPVLSLERIGPRSALAVIGASCTRGASSRALFVVRLAREPAVAFALAVVDPAGAPKLEVDVDGADRDHDGIDDVALRLTIEGSTAPFEPGPKLSAQVAFFDRSAGASRDPGEPEASLRAIAARATARAAKAKDAPTVPILVRQMRMLYRAMCSEGGAPRLVELRGGAASGAISCGSSKPLEDAGVAAVRAYVAMGDALRAVAAAESAQVAPATKTAARTTEIAKLLADVAPFVDARATRMAGITLPAPRSAHPHWGALAFEPSGALLVRGPTQVLRVNPDTAESSPADVPAWPTQVLSPDGSSRWLEAYHACEGVGLRATFAPTGVDGDMKDVLLPVAPPLGSRCAGVAARPPRRCRSPGGRAASRRSSPASRCSCGPACRPRRSWRRCSARCRRSARRARPADARWRSRRPRACSSRRRRRRAIGRPSSSPTPSSRSARPTTTPLASRASSAAAAW